MSSELIAPRLQFTWKNESGDKVNWVCQYALVLPLSEFDCRRGDENRSELVIEIGSTAVTMGAPRLPIYGGDVQTPFRDGAHAKWDRNALGSTLPILAVCGDVVTDVTHREKNEHE